MLDHALVALDPEQSTPSYPELLTLTETADVLGAAPEYVEAAVIAGDIPAKRLGGTWRILRAWLSEVSSLGVETS